ncbi:hypothetical protein NBRC10512_005379 [Rhodotorula toruloides]|uniref:RHTO0S01e09252g1_1 n=1 Tax=Rhodotorula toruloides TaxID=5286 RepID=A0A061AE85_RHOTO|nr:RHTO0S01e09252g1_1 [Rhodotorula toruloides]
MTAQADPTTRHAAVPAGHASASSHGASTSGPVGRSAGQTELDFEDGPLYRAHLASHERRAKNLRAALKKLQKSLDASLAALEANANAQRSVDEALEELSAGSMTSQSDTLGGLYERELMASRAKTRDNVKKELDRGREMSERVKGAVERIKALEERKRGFEVDAKRYYDDLAKYLSRGDSDTAKIASLDAKQAERAATFRQLRIDYFSFVEGLVESEERAVATWLRTWASVREAQVPNEDGREASLRALEGRKASNGYSPGLGDLPDYLVDAISSPSSNGAELRSDDGHSAAPTSLHSAISRITTPGETTLSPPIPTSPTQDDPRRRRRTSMPFGMGGAKGKDEKDGDRKRDRLKEFFKSAQQSITSALPASASSAHLALDALPRLSQPPSPLPTSATSPTAPSGPQHAPIASQLAPALSLVPPPALSRPSGSQPRRKEGFLFATETGQKHTQSGDGGRPYQRFWVVLGEGQLTEYDKWTDAMQVHGSPINLRYATARISKQAGERRFAFEVLTPELRRVYQASSEQECRDWVEAIQRSVEALLNGTSSVRNFDASRLQGMSKSPTLQDVHGFAEPPSSPKSRFPALISRRASLGHHRKSSHGLSKKDKRRSQQSPPIPSLTIGAPVDRSFFDASSRRGLFAFSENDADEPPPRLSLSNSRPGLNGLGIPFPSFGSSAQASKSSPELPLQPNLRILSSGSRSIPSSSAAEDDEDDSASMLSAQDRAISDAVRGWAASEPGSQSLRSSTRSVDDAKYRNAQRVAALAEEAGNNLCADCRAPEPKWASWNLGITLCIRCSGVHRSLGTHISKVRSIELDDWSDEQLAPLTEIGNVRSNEFYEAKLPAGTTAALADSTIASFIREKYVDKRWASASPPSNARVSP